MDNECPICYNELSETVKCTFTCKHSVCSTCNISLQKCCPLCRADIINITFSGGSVLFIKTLKGTTDTIYINLKHITVNETLMLVASKFGYRDKEIKLMFNNKILNNNKTLFDYDIKEHDTLRFIRGLRI